MTWEMDLQDVFGDTRWSLLKELAKGSKSASELARKANMSTAHATNQLSLLEAKGIIKKCKTAVRADKASAEKRPAGKPKKPYELVDDIILTGVLRNGMAERRVSKARDLGDYERFALATFFTLEADEAYAVNKFCLETGMLRKAEMIGLLKTHSNDIELFLVSENHLIEIREKHSNSHIEAISGKSKKIISWSHSKKEVEEGLAKGESYFQNLVKSQELLDKKGLLQEWSK